MIHIIKDFTMFELSIEVIFVISILIILTILSFIPEIRKISNRTVDDIKKVEENKK